MVHLAVLVEPRVAVLLHRPDPVGDFDAFFVHRLQHLLEAQRVPHPERPHLPAEAPADGAVGVGGAGGDLGDAAGGVAQQVERRVAEERACPARVVPQRVEARGEVARLLDGVEVADADVSGVLVLPGLRVDGANVLAFFLVEPGARFGAQRPGIDQTRQHGGHAEALAALVVPRLLVEVRRHVAQHVKAHDVGGAERRALGMPDERPRQRVDLLDGIVARGEKLHRAQHRVDAQPVADEIRHVVRDDDAFAQMHAPEMRHPRQHLRVGVVCRDEFEEFEVARRVEKVRADKALLETIRPPLGDLVDGNAARVGRDHGVVARVLLDARHHAALHVELFDDDLDDPVGLRDALEIVLEVAEPHACLALLVEKRIGRQLLNRLPRLLDDGVVRPLFADGFRRDVEQIDRQPCVGEVRGDLRAHRPGAQHGGMAERRMGGRGGGAVSGGLCEFHISKGFDSGWQGRYEVRPYRCLGGGRGNEFRPQPHHTKALKPVIARPTTSVLISLVPS